MPLWNESGYGNARWDLAGGEVPGGEVQGGSDWWTISYDGGATHTNFLSLIEFDGDLYAGTDGGVILTTADGSVWTVAYDSLEDEIHSFEIFGGDLYAVTGNNGRILTSTDGSTWTVAYDSPQTDLFAIKTFGSNLYAGGDGGVIYSSSNGSTWTLAYDSPQTTIHAFEEFNGSMYVATGANGVIYATTNGTSYTLAHDDGSIGSFLSLAAMDPSADPYVSDKLFAGSDTGFEILETTDGTTWTVSYDGPDARGAVNTMYATDATVYAGSSLGGATYKSDDGITWMISYDSPEVSVNAMTGWTLDNKQYLAVDEFVFRQDNLPKLNIADTVVDITVADGGETLTTDSVTIQWSVEDDTNLVFDVEFTRNYSTNRVWETAVDDTGGDPAHTGAPLTGISGTPNGEYLEATWNILPLVDSSDVKLRIRARDTSASTAQSIGGWNESEDTFELQNGPC